MAKSKDVNELTHMWQQWHDETGRPLRSKFIRYVELSNEAARLNGKKQNAYVIMNLYWRGARYLPETSVRPYRSRFNEGV